MGSSKKSKRSQPFKKIALLVGGVGVICALYWGINLYNRVYRSNVDLKGEKVAHVCIPTGSDFNAAMATFKASGFIKDFDSFERYANARGYFKKVRPGRYKLTKGMSNHQILDIIQSGMQDPVKVSINNIRTKERLAAILGKYLEPDSTKIIALLNSDTVTAAYGLKPETIITLFVPNTYELYWNTTPEDLLARMKKESDSFWSKKSRQQKADSMGYSRDQVFTLASIVNSETNSVPEMPTIASVYLNRLKKGMLLQADPTVKFAVGDPTIRRILNKHLSFNSPYNTYMYKGLPPGPIAIPSISAIDAVLNSAKTDYLYFCAKADFSGVHAFAVTHDDHIKNAQAYQRALNERNIKK